MDTRYAFSLNGQNYQGSFTSRRDARAAAFAAAGLMQETPSVVYIGKIQQADPHTTNHARQLVREMSRQARDIDGNDNYLSGLTVDQISDLNRSVSQVLEQWLDRHTLRPAGFQVQAVSEYPVPTPHEVAAPVGQQAETDDSLGAGPGSAIVMDPQS